RNSSDNFLFGVDCTDANDCVAVGRSVALRTGAIKSLVLTLVDDTWVITPTPNRAGVDNYLAEVSCSDANHCAAVGYTAPPTGSSASYQPLVLTTDGTDWTIANTPNVASAHNLLRDVSCPSRTTCVAVGGASATTGETALIETLAGGTWSITTSANRAGNDN